VTVSEDSDPIEEIGGDYTCTGMVERTGGEPEVDAVDDDVDR
jgi:hypothetical protein